MDALKVFTGIENLIAKYKPDCFTISFFDLLEDSMTDCLALALFNEKGIIGD